MAEPLSGRVVVLSPHLDDAALSLGATIAAAVRRGADVTVLTVFANDPDADGPARPWDRACGFGSAAEAARGRRAEDAEALSLLGARPDWLPFPDRQHADDRGGDRVWSQVRARLAGADTVLAPGWPLYHADHAWLAARVLDDPPHGRLLLFIEQPYAADAPLLAALGRRPGPVRIRPGLAPALVGRMPPPRWRAHRPRPQDWRLKQRAIAAYASQLGELGPALRARIAAYEAVLGAEATCAPAVTARAGAPG